MTPIILSYPTVEDLEPTPAEVSVWLSCVPSKTTHQHKKIIRLGGFSRLADKPELVATKEALDALLAPHRPKTPLDGPLSLSLVYVYPWRKSEPQKNKTTGRKWMTSKPDCTNISKTLEDRLVRLGFMLDDAQVCSLHVSKLWGDEPGIKVEIRKVS